MASLVEFQEFKLTPVFSDLQAFGDILGSMELPTPPLSPDHAEATDSTQLSAQPQGDLDIGETILQQMMDSEDVLFDSQGLMYGSNSMDTIDVDPSILGGGNPPQAFLVQDCMWNCDAYEPRHSISGNGVYTPAPSPPPEMKGIMKEDDDPMPAFEPVPESKEVQEEDLDEDAESMISSQVSVDTATDSSCSRDEGLKHCTKVERENRKPGLFYRRSSCNGSSRIHPQATTSESGETKAFGVNSVSALVLRFYPSCLKGHSQSTCLLHAYCKSLSLSLSLQMKRLMWSLYHQIGLTRN